MGSLMQLRLQLRRLRLRSEMHIPIRMSAELICTNREMNDDAKQPGRIDSSRRWRDETVLTGILIGVMAIVLFDLIVASIRHMP